jgi:two-component system alkaline phosphatase synthesis response regulator PhoP
MSKSRILLVEDEESLREAIKINLELEGYSVVEAATGGKALQQALQGKYDLIILDVMLPEVNGFDVCEKIRLTDTQTPIIFLTAKHAIKDRVEGLKRGADDYLAKPFNLEELLLRVKSLLKRTVTHIAKEDEALTIYYFGKNKINFTNSKAVGANGKEFELTVRELRLLNYLIKNKNKSLSRQQILLFVWEYKDYPNTRTIDNFILNLRRYFEIDPGNPKHFRSVHGVGYMFSE